MEIIDSIKTFLHKKRTVKEISIYGLGNITSRLISYLLVPLHTAVLSPKSYGIICEMYSYIAFLQIIYSLGFDSAYFRFARLAAYKNFAKTLSIISSSIFSLAIYGTLYFTGFLEKIFHTTSISSTYIAICLAILTVESLLNIHFLHFRHKRKIMIFSTVKLLQVFINVTINSIIFFFHLKVSALSEEYLVCSVLAANLFSSFIIFYILTTRDEKFKITISKRLIIRSITFGFPFIYMSLILICNDLLSKIALRMWLPSNLFIGKSIEHTIGVVSACQKVSTIISLGTQAYRYTIEPFLFRGSALRKNYYNANLFWFSVFGCLTVMLISVNLNIIGKIFLRRHDYFFALAIVPTLLISNLLNGIYYNLSFWTKTLNKVKISTMISTINFISNIIFAYFTVPKFGYWGIAISPTLSGLLSCLLAFIFAKKYNIHFKLSFITILFAITYFASIFFLKNNISEISILKNIMISLSIIIGVMGCSTLYSRKFMFR